MHRKFVIILLVVVVMMVGVGVQVAPATAQGGALSGMLASVPATDSASSVIWYGSLGDLAGVLGLQVNSLSDVTQLPNASRLTYLAEIGQQVYYSGYSGLSNPQEWQATFGINSFAIRRELTVGTGNLQFAVLDGNFDAGTIASTLQANGYQAGQVGGATALLGGNSTGRFGAVIPTNNRVLIAPQVEALAALFTANRAITDNPAYAAVAAALESSQTAPNTTLLSAVLFSANHLSRNMISTASPGPDGLPAFSTGGIGYRRGGNSRALVIALAYEDSGAAQTAGAILVQRLQNFVRQDEPDRKAFGAWPFSAQVFSAGGRFVVAVSSTYPAEADLAWLTLVQNKDLGFLRIQ